MLDYRLDDGIATVTLDDGRVNALGPAMLFAVDAALDRAEADAATVVLAGRPGIFSAGFDLTVFQQGGLAATSMVRTGFEVAVRVLAYPRPVVAAVTGHAVAMGAFLMLAADHRVGPQGAFRTVANEVQIGLTVPRPALEILRHRLTPAAFARAATLSAPSANEEAVAAGWYTELVDPDAVVAHAREVAEVLQALDPAAFRGTKQRVNGPVGEAMTAGIGADFAALRHGG